MSESLFRKAALDRMASQERLDAPIRLVGPAHWLALGAFAGIAVAALAWASLAFAPVKVTGRGMLMGEKGLAEIVASEAGQIATVLVSAGEGVKAGAPIATLNHDALDREIADLRMRVDQANARLDRILRAQPASGAGRAAPTSESLLVLDAQDRVDALQGDLTRAERGLAERTVVRAPADGRVVELRIGAGDVITAGSVLATLVAADASDKTVAVLYVPAGTGKRIAPGMPAEVLPQATEREIYGFIRGSVVSVAPLPATREGMRRVLRNDQLVDQLLRDGAVVEVRVALQADPSTPSGVVWSTSTGPATGVGAGALAEAGIVIDRKRIIRWLLPGRE